MGNSHSRDKLFSKCNLAQVFSPLLFSPHTSLNLTTNLSKFYNGILSSYLMYFESLIGNLPVYYFSHLDLNFRKIQI